MRKILIINLRRLGDVYSTAHLINSLSAGSENQISILTYKESSGAALNLKNITKRYEIDRKEIITLKSNKLFSDGFALEQLYKQIEIIKKEDWDQVINYSNDNVGAYLTSYLKESSKQVIGVHFNSKRNVVTQNDWEVLFNDILPVIKYAPIHFVDCYHKMAGVSLVKNGDKLNSNAEYDDSAYNSIEAARKAHSINKGQSKIIGIQLKTADISKDIPEKTLHELITLIRKNTDLIPFLLIAPNEEERQMAELFNRAHNDEIIVVEADLVAIVSVLKNIDLLITPDTAVKHIADLVDTPVLEISLGHSPFLKQGTYSKSGLILTDIITERSFNKKNIHTASNITAQDILVSALYALSQTKTIKPRLSIGLTLYQTSFDKMGLRYIPVSGAFDSSIEIGRLMSRQLVYSMFEQNNETSVYRDVCSLDLMAAQSWTNKEKTSVTNVTKDLLGTLRSLLLCAENQKSSREFVIHLGKLISHIETDSLVQIPVSLFKIKIEAINAKSFEENAKEVEILLYELKSDLQKILLCLNELEFQINASKVDDMITRTAETIKTTV